MASRKLSFWLLLLIVVVIGAALMIRWDRARSVQPVPIVPVERQDIRSGVVTNGKAEPIEYRDVRAEIEGQIAEAPVHDGDKVARGQKLVGIEQRQVSADVEHARAEVAEAEDALRLLKQGGTASDLRELLAHIDLAKREREEAAKAVAINERLVEKGAVARIELQQSRDRLAKAESDLAVLEQKQKNRYDPEELKRAEAAVTSSRAALNLVLSRQRSLTVVAPLSGVAYSFAVRLGDYVHPGDLLLRVGDIHRIRVRVYVDEPDLGRVIKAQSVEVTWDGLPGRQWRGSVDRLPTEIKDLGTRKVGEVTCLLDNPKLELLPNMNLNVEIVTDERLGALVIPREAIFGTGANRQVYLVQDGIAVKKTVQTGISNATRVEILQGLKDGDRVILDRESQLREGLRVRDSAE
jgi:HlyD family secretion protein